MSKHKDIKLNHNNRQELTLGELQDDVIAAKKKYGHYQFCFTWLTVQALIDKVVELSEQNESLTIEFNDLKGAFKDASDELNHREY